MTRLRGKTGHLPRGIEPDNTDQDVPEKKNVHILIAEDNVVNQRVVLRMLERGGYSADVVGNGEEAVKALSCKTYDMVLMDVQMPDMDGLEATKIIRESNNGITNKDIPIIALTAHAMKGDRERCLQAGMDDYLTKPIAPDALRECVERWGERKDAKPV
jgi:CheY-like chemotaxis protein